MFCDVGAHVDEDEFFDAGGFGHASGAGGSALPVSFAVLGHDFLVVPAHAEHDVGVCGRESMTESQGWVSPVKTMDLPPLVSSR